MDAAIFGLIVADLIAEPMDLRRPPKPGGLAFTNSIQLTTGGNVCNTGIAMAKLGMNVAAAGLVGDDVLGVAVTERLRHAGLDTSAVFKSDEGQTSATVVAVEPGGERCFFHTPGVTKLLEAATFRQCFPMFKRCKYVQIGYFGLLPALTHELPALLAELRRYAPDIQIALDTVNPPGPWEQLVPILPHLDVFCPSRSEAAALTGETEPGRMVGAFKRHMRDDVILGIKLDADGCYIEVTESRGILVPAYRVTPVDTTGAGDTWFAGLLTGLIRGMDIDQAGRLANRVAADCCTALGASAGVKSFEETVGRL